MFYNLISLIFINRRNLSQSKDIRFFFIVKMINIFGFIQKRVTYKLKSSF
ncbi:hypothetical protein BN165_590012 [Clostridioides difficile E1]|nr:hypothetical protein BN163_620012 [Clostridioides difficile T5]CCK93118.1 hypothetical protein BN164_570012 [Clostridioides difficile T20]CCK96745.1 hypothetical protein BN165_590012 [Clostridioides difficile E1]CCL00778.1 hypothetical protein BN166_600012 [Clostridioides difficile E10]